jgi:hypothetical protein
MRSERCRAFQGKDESVSELVLPVRITRDSLTAFANNLQEISDQVGMKMSARGWAYFCEGLRLINKDQFDRVENLINECRQRGYLPVDFTAEEEARKFAGVEDVADYPPEHLIRMYLKAALNSGHYYTPDWWEDETYYIQMIVEKVDLKSLFEPVCKRYKIPIATARGWASITMRANYARRFKEAEDDGKVCVLLYCGDFDPDGLRISEFLRSNLKDIKDVVWSDKTTGYNPASLKIDRFGMNYDFIESNHLTWIDNLITGSKGCIARVKNGKIVRGTTAGGKPHPNFPMGYVQNYLNEYGVRKCEANAMVKAKEASMTLCKEAIEKWLGRDADIRFIAKREAQIAYVKEYIDRLKLRKPIEKAIAKITKEIGPEEEDE